MNYKTSCVIVNYNDWKRTEKLVETIYNYDIITHIIVVDNCSTDDSEKYLSIISGEKYIFIQTGFNGGYGYGNNKGINKAIELEDEYILIVNPDVVFDEQCVRHMIQLINNDKSCGIVGAKEEYIGNNGWKYTSSTKDVLTTSLFLNKIFKWRYYDDSYFQEKGKVQVDVIPGCFLLTRVDYITEAGLYDENIFLYEEEKVLYKKYSELGLYSMVDLDVSYEHRHKSDSSQSIQKNVLNKKTLIRSKMYFLKKYRHFNHVQLILSALFFKCCILEMIVYTLLRKLLR